MVLWSIVLRKSTTMASPHFPLCQITQAAELCRPFWPTRGMRLTKIKCSGYSLTNVLGINVHVLAFIMIIFLLLQRLNDKGVQQGIRWRSAFFQSGCRFLFPPCKLGQLVLREEAGPFQWQDGVGRSLSRFKINVIWPWATSTLVH